MANKKERKEAIDSFRVKGISLPPLTRFIPVCTIRRRFFYRRLAGLPPYAVFKRRNMKAEDLEALDRTWWIDFLYKGARYKVVVRKFAVYDAASVPAFLVRGKLTKRGQHVQEAALLHDVCFALKPFSFEDANNLFVAMLKWLGLIAPVTIKLYEIGVRSPVGKKIFKEADPKKHWLKDYVEIYKSEDAAVRPTIRIM